MATNLGSNPSLQADSNGWKRSDEVSLVDRELDLRLFVDSVPGFVSTMGPAGEWQFLNCRILEFFGKSPEAIKDWASEDIVHPDDLSRVSAGFRTSIETGQPYDSEHRYRRFDGSYHWFNVRALPLRDAGGQIIGWYALHTDIDDRRRAEKKLRRSEASLAEAQRLTHCGSWSWDVRTRDGFWSREMFQILGYNPENTTPTLAHFLARVHPEDRPMVEQIVQKEMSGLDGNLPSDYRILLPDGTMKHLHGIAHPVTNELGEVVEIIGTSMDVTEHRLAQAKLENAFEEIERLKGRLH